MIEPVATPGKSRKVALASIRGPKRQKQGEFESGYSVDAIEFLRSRLVGVKVFVKVDYIKPAEGEYEQKECVTIIKGEKNIGELLVNRGLASVIRHRKDDNNRSHAYDQLLAAEERAIEAKKGIHSEKELPVHRIVDASENAAKSRSYFAQLSRSNVLKGIVEYVASGSRLRVFVPSQGLRLSFILSGIRTPKVGRGNQASEPFGDEAAEFTSKLAFQRDVEISVESQDKVGGFIGSLYVNFPGGGRGNLAVMLLEQGLSSVHEYSASQSAHANQLFAAESKAKEAKLNIWKTWTPVVEETAAELSKLDVSTPVIKEVIVCEIERSGKIYVQLVTPGIKPPNKRAPKTRYFDEPVLCTS